MPALDPIVLISWADDGDGDRAVSFPRDLRDRFLELSYTDKVRGADECDISLFNGDLALFDDPRIAENNKLHVQWGYRHEMGPVRVCTIREVTGWSTLRLRCASTEELGFIERERTRTFENMTIPEIARQVARELGYSEDSIDIESPQDMRRFETITQTAETDFAFLQGLADSEDFVFRVVGGVFEFHAPRLDDQPWWAITYWDSAIGQFAGEPSITKGTLGIPGRVTRRGHSVRERKTVEGSASNSTDTTRPSLGETVLVIDPETNEWRRRRLPPGAQGGGGVATNQRDVRGATSAEDDVEATRQARRQFRRAERRAIEMTWPLVGIPNLRADTVVRLDGVGERLTGNYWVEEITHKISSSGYTCDAKVKRNAESRSSAGRGRATTVGAKQEAIWRSERAQWDAAVADGTMTAAERTRRIGEQVRARATGEANARAETQGQPNTATPPAAGASVPVLVYDPDSGNFVRAWRDPGRGGGTSQQGRR